MKPYSEYPMKNGFLLVTVNGYSGEDDFNIMQRIIEEILQPEDMGYSVDSMCIGGYFVKDGISVRTSSESPYDFLSFYYNPGALPENKKDCVNSWLTEVINELHIRKPLP
ncbi:MAG: hypothetical protein ACI4LC_06835 [Emergencia sp.]